MDLREGGQAPRIFRPFLINGTRISGGGKVGGGGGGTVACVVYCWGIGATAASKRENNNFCSSSFAVICALPGREGGGRLQIRFVCVDNRLIHPPERVTRVRTQYWPKPFVLWGNFFLNR